MYHNEYEVNFGYDVFMQKSKSFFFSLVILSVALIFFIYGIYKAIAIVNKTQIGTSDGIYTSYVSEDTEIKRKAFSLTKMCQSQICDVQKLLDFVTNIPYHTALFQKKVAKHMLEENFGDCDDKSNLLISLLHARDIEAYLVLVPHHIFVIVSLDKTRPLSIKGLWVNTKKYYILESTAKNSKIGYPLQYRLDEIQAILEPFTNMKFEDPTLDYK